MWMSTYLCALRDEAKALNTIALQGLPGHAGHSETKCITCTQPRLASVPAYSRYLRQLPALYVRALPLS
jgi:hypothetical protein